MKRLFLPLILFLTVILEGVALELLPARLVTGELLIIPHWAFVLLVCVAIFYDRENTYTSVFYAVIFGLMIDIVYTGILGVYMFTYALVIYVVHGLKKLLHANFYVTLLLGFLGIVLSDVMIYIVYSVVGIADIAFTHYILYRLIPTALANELFLLILYPLVRRRLNEWSKEQLRG